MLYLFLFFGNDKYKVNLSLFFNIKMTSISIKASWVKLMIEDKFIFYNPKEEVVVFHPPFFLKDIDHFLKFYQFNLGKKEFSKLLENSLKAHNENLANGKKDGKDYNLDPLTNKRELSDCITICKSESLEKVLKHVFNIKYKISPSYQYKSTNGTITCMMILKDKIIFTSDPRQTKSQSKDNVDMKALHHLIPSIYDEIIQIEQSKKDKKKLIHLNRKRPRDEAAEKQESDSTPIVQKENKNTNNENVPKKKKKKQINNLDKKDEQNKKESQENKEVQINNELSKKVFEDIQMKENKPPKENEKVQKNKNKQIDENSNENKVNNYNNANQPQINQTSLITHHQLINNPNQVNHFHQVNQEKIPHLTQINHSQQMNHPNHINQKSQVNAANPVNQHSQINQPKKTTQTKKNNQVNLNNKSIPPNQQKPTFKVNKPVQENKVNQENITQPRKKRKNQKNNQKEILQKNEEEQKMKSFEEEEKHNSSLNEEYHDECTFLRIDDPEIVEKYSSNFEFNPLKVRKTFNFLISFS